ncbi:MAG: M15 family metallopeptidase [Firmicutes bacterium]|nr:M15 family metallopeptidase [Bacillota bacterium]
MQILKKGSTGQDVEKWQAFLRGSSPTSLVLISGIFDDVTDKETKVFQKKKNLTPDGVVGSKTLAVALQTGFGLMEDSTCDQDGPGWPSKPTHGPLSYTDREKLFGRFSYVSSPVASSPEAITITGNWALNISQIVIPELAGIPGVPRSCSVQFHSTLGPQVIKLFKDWDSAGLRYLILTWGGSWVPRFVRGSRTTLSNHAWGTAFDINVAWNGLGVQPALRGETGSVRELVDIAYENGFYWGGWFPRRPDGMHFEAYKIL